MFVVADAGRCPLELRRRCLDQPLTLIFNLQFLHRFVSAADDGRADAGRVGRTVEGVPPGVPRRKDCIVDAR